jgi:hypothetical protein
VQRRRAGCRQSARISLPFPTEHVAISQPQGATESDQAPITDEELAEAIRVSGHQVPNGIKVLQLILDHIPPETRRVPWNGQQD